MSAKKKFTVEVMYFLPVFKTMIVEAENVEQACQIANATADEEGWESAEEGYDDSTTHFVSNVCEGEYDNVFLGDWRAIPVPTDESFVGRGVRDSLNSGFED